MPLLQPNTNVSSTTRKRQTTRAIGDLAKASGRLDVAYREVSYLQSASTTWQAKLANLSGRCAPPGSLRPQPSVLQWWDRRAWQLTRRPADGRHPHCCRLRHTEAQLLDKSEQLKVGPGVVGWRAHLVTYMPPRLPAAGGRRARRRQRRALSPAAT